MSNQQSRRGRRARVVVVLLLALPLLLAGCGADDSAPGGSRTLTVYAASSLKGTFEALGREFEASHEGVTVTFNFAGSSDLAAQLQEGARADVFASADNANMDKLVSDDLTAAAPLDFATNTLQIAVPPSNPAGVHALPDLARKGIKLVICAPEVPCGAATARVEQDAGLSFAPVSEEQSVTDVLGKVRSGEADAGLVYVTDVLAAGDTVEGVAFPESAAAVNTYPIAPLKGADQAELGQEFIDLVTGPDGQRVLSEAGFGSP